MENDGYVKSSDYEDLYFDTLNPHIINLNLLLAGFKPVRCGDYLELGFGMGRSLITNAVCGAGNFFGTDFNQNQVRFARKICEEAAIPNLTLYHDSFEELLARLRKMREDGLEVGFDFITLHGIYCWVSYENQQTILSIIEEFLRPGGVVYVSYNCLPGKAKAMNARQIFKRFADNEGTEDFREIFAFTEKFARLDPQSEKNKDILNLIAEWRHAHPTYLSHEFLNDSWHLPYFYDVALAMQKRGLEWACEDVLAYHFKRLSPEQEDFLKGLRGKNFKEQMRDFILDKDFRYDLYVKNPTRLSKKEVQSTFLELSFSLADYPTTEHFEHCTDEVKFAYAQIIAKFERDDFAPKKAKNLFLKELDFHTNASILNNLTTLRLLILHTKSQATATIRRYNHLTLQGQTQGENILAHGGGGGG